MHQLLTVYRARNLHAGYGDSRFGDGTEGGSGVRYTPRCIGNLGTRPRHLLCTRSTDESTFRTASGRRPPLLPATFHGSSAIRSSTVSPSAEIEPIFGKRKSKCESEPACFKIKLGSP